MVGFIGREQDLGVLEREFGEGRASLVILYGRRRIGKSTLIRQASLKRSAIYFQATLVDDSLNLAAFKGEISRVLGGDPVLDSISDWLGVLHYVAKRAEHNRGMVVALDEFPYLVGGNPGLPSIMQKFWDSRAAESGALKIVLCGSLIAQMEELLAERNPLYGRKTLAREILPMSLRDAAEFVPQWEPADAISLFSVLGGVPYYLDMCDQSQTLAENIKRLFLAPSASLQEEPEFLLRSELNEVRRYASIAAAIADGATKPSEIVSRVHGLTGASEVSTYINRLQQMRVVARERSLDADERSRNTRYSLQDPLFRFWYRFVRPNLGTLGRGFGDDVWARNILPYFNEYMGSAFETVARDHLRDHARERFSVPAGNIGRIWGGDFEIDVAGQLLDGSAVFGECKWENALIGQSTRKRLEEYVAKTRYAEDARSRHLVFFARKGFTEELRKTAEIDGGIQLFDLEELVRSPDPHPAPSPP
ncbi:ATP-binding protein [Bradyrhizobium sp.]|uniref:ATP-binding protein n=1 Tax=Bradyrhizobium sp. TaxID=376 RepID=UPI003C16AD3E